MTRLLRCVAVLIIFLLVGPPAVLSSNAVIIEDPCSCLVDRVPKDALTISGYKKYVNIDAKAMFTTICDQIRDEIINAMLDQAKTIVNYDRYSKLLPKDLADLKQRIYEKSLKFVLPLVNERVLARLSDEEKIKFNKQIEKNPKLAIKWLEDPQSELTELVNKYISESSEIGKLYVRYSTDGSTTIIEGLSAIFNTAYQRLSQMGKAESSIEIDTTQMPTTELLEAAGISGEWLNTFAKYEGAIRGINQYAKSSQTIMALVKTIGILYDALQADDPEKKIQLLMALIKTIGEGAEGTQIPIVALMGTIVKSYGEVGEQLLVQSSSLREQIYKRDGYCLGIGPHNILKNERQLALKPFLNDAYNEGMICPLGKGHLLSRIYYNTGDESQLLFWVGGRFEKGQADGGGTEAVHKLIDLLNEAPVKSAYAKYTKLLKPSKEKDKDKKEKDLDKKAQAFANMYNTVFSAKLFTNQKKQTGILGLVEEAEKIVESIIDKDKTLRKQIREAYLECSQDNYYQYLQNRTQFNFKLFPTTMELQKKLRLSYVFSYIDGYKQKAFQKSAYKRYSDAWRKLKDISTVTIRTGFRDASSSTCNRCINLPMKMTITNGEQIPECKLESADGNGIVKGIVFSTSPNITIKLQDNDRDATAELTIDAKMLGINDVPYYKRFDPDYMQVSFSGQQNKTKRAPPQQTPPPDADHAGTIDAIEAFITTCHFQSAQELIGTLPEQLQGKLTRKMQTAKLDASEVRHLFRKARNAIKENKTTQAKQWIDEAHGLFKCPGQEQELIAIKQDLKEQAQRTDEGEDALNKAKNCQFKEARELVLKLPKSSPIRKQVKEIFAREKKARDLYRKAKAAKEEGKLDLANRLFQKALDTTTCEATRKVINAQLDDISDGFEMPPLEAQEKPKTQENLDAMIAQANRDIDNCNLDAARQMIARIGQFSNHDAGQLLQTLKEKEDAIRSHQRNLSSLASAVSSGDFQQVKSSIRTAMGSLACPGDREQLKRIVQKVKTIINQEAASNRSAMDNAIRKGQQSQHRAAQRRRAIADAILDAARQVGGASGGGPRNGGSGSTGSSGGSGGTDGGGATLCQQLWQQLRETRRRSELAVQNNDTARLNIENRKALDLNRRIESAGCNR